MSEKHTDPDKKITSRLVSAVSDSIIAKVYRAKSKKWESGRRDNSPPHRSTAVSRTLPSPVSCDRINEDQFERTNRR